MASPGSNSHMRIAPPLPERLPREVDPGPLLKDATFAAIDFESAGAARGRTDTPVQLGMAVWSLAGGHRDAFHSYLHSGQKITWSARKVHGIRDDDLAGAPRLQELWGSVKRQLSGAVVVAHGVGTEKRFLRAFPGHRFGPWLDTLLVARCAYPSLASHSLSEICEALGLAGRVFAMHPDRKWHDALFDATASLVVLEHVIADHDLADRGVEILLRPDLSHWSALRRK